MRVTDGEHHFDVENALLTNDLDIATAVIRRESQSRQGINRYMQQQQEAAAKAEADKNRAFSQEDAMKKRIRQLEIERDSQPEMIPGLRPTPRVNPLDLPARR